MYIHINSEGTRFQMQGVAMPAKRLSPSLWSCGIPLGTDSGSAYTYYYYYYY